MDIFQGIWDWLSSLVTGLLDWLISFLPDSPFVMLDNTPIRDILPTLNWFIPVQFILNVLLMWLTAVSLYYVYSAYLRWAKAIQ